MRVLLWGELFWPYIGGAELFAAKLLLALRERGYELAVVTSHDYLDLPDEADYRGTPVYRFPFRTALQPEHLDQLMSLRRRVAALCQAWKPNVIHLNGISPSAFFCTYAAQASGAALVVRLNQELTPTQSRGGAGTLLETVLRRATWVTGVSAATLEEARHFVPEIAGRLSLIYNGVDAPSQTPVPAPAGPPRILCLGRLAYQKGFDLAIAAFPPILLRWPRARLIVAGDGTERAALQEQAAALGIAAAVDFVGWVAPDAVPALLSGVTMVMIPSRSEGLPTVALQAAAMGRPVVATRTGGLAEVVQHGQTGLLTDKDSGALGAALAALLEQPDVAIRMGIAAWRRAQEMFDEKRGVDAYDELYRKLAAHQ